MANSEITAFHPIQAGFGKKEEENKRIDSCYTYLVFMFAVSLAPDGNIQLAPEQRVTDWLKVHRTRILRNIFSKQLGRVLYGRRSYLQISDALRSSHRL